MWPREGGGLRLRRRNPWLAGKTPLAWREGRKGSGAKDDCGGRRGRMVRAEIGRI